VRHCHHYTARYSLPTNMGDAVMANFTGTSGNDNLTGTSGNDKFDPKM
jgi:hypothetical protein